MAQGAFNLTAQINLRGPANLRTIVADIRRQVGTISVDINPRINSGTQRSIADLNRAFRDLNTTLAITEANSRTTANALNNLGQAVNSIGARNLQQNLNNAARATQNLSRQTQAAAAGANQAATGMEQFGRQSALAIRRFAAFSIVTSAVTSFVSAIKSGTSAFIDFDKEFVRLKQVSSAGSASLDLLSKSISELSTNLGVSSKDLTTVSVTLAQAGLSIRETEQALKALAKSALAPSFDNLNDTVEGSIALMRQFGISSGDLESALGSVNAVAAAFAVEASDLIAAIQRTGGVFATASKGVSEGTDALNEFLAIFTSIRQTTRESAENIATGLRTIFTRIQRGTTIEALKEYGVVLTDLENKFVGPYEAVKRLSEGLSSLDPRDIRFSKIVEELGGFRQIGKVIPLIQQFAVAQEALKVAQKGSDSLAKDSAIAQLALANQISKVREEFLALIRSIGQSESFRSFISLALDLTSGLIKLADAAKTVLPALTALAAIRGVSALTQFGAGFAGAFSAAGGARGLGQRLGGGRRFASGGLVPGSGNTDSVKAMLTPGEFVIRKKAVQTIGADNLAQMNSGGYVQKFAKGMGVRSLKGIRKGARSSIRELTSEEISQLSTADMIKYAKKQAYDIFTRGGAGMVTGMKFVPVPKERIIPEIEGDLQTYLGQKGFWQEQISPFGRPRAGSAKAKSKISREKALSKQQSRLSDEVAARAQEWTSIKQGSSIDNYLLSSLKEPVLSDYQTVRGGGSLSKAFHNTRLRQSVNKALDSFDDFDYSSGNIDKFVSAFAAKKFADGGMVQRFSNGQEVLGKRERRIQRGYGAGGSGPLQFGLVGLRSGLNDVESLPTYLQEPLTTPKKRSVQLNLGTISNTYKKDFSKQIEGKLKESFTNAVVNLSTSLAKKIGASSSPSKGRVDRVLEGSGFTSVVGSGLEAALALIGAPYIDKTEATKSLDFPYGLGKAAPLFGNGFPSRVPTDVTRTIGGFGKGKGAILNQIDRFIDATEGGEFTKAFQARLSRKTAKSLSPTLSGILSTLGNRSVKDIAAPGIAKKLLDTYGIKARGGLGKSSLEKTLRELPENQQSSFLSDLNKVVSTGRFATGGSVEDSVQALLTPGEFVINKKSAARLGASRLHQLNRADKVQGFNKGGPVGFVQRFATGGNVENGNTFNFSDLFSNFSILTGAIIGLSAGVLTLRNNFGTISTNIQRFGQSLGTVNRNVVGFPRTGTGSARPGGPRAGIRNFANQGSAIPPRGGLGNAGSFIALAAGGAAVEGLAGLAGEKSVNSLTGVRNKDLISGIGGDVLNYAAIGATIGSLVPVVGTALGTIAGAAVGVYTGFNRAAQATEEYNKQIQEVSIEEQRKKLAQQEAENQKKLAEQQKKLQEAFGNLQEISISLADAYNLSSARLERFGADLDNLSAGVSGTLSALSGQARLQKVSRRDEQILGNVSGYSLREVRGVGSRVAGLVGGQQGKELGQTVAAQKIIQEQLPALLRASAGQGGIDPATTSRQIRKLLENQLNEPLTGPINTLLDEVQKKLVGLTIGTDQESNIDEIAGEIGKLFGPVSEAAQKVAQNLTSQFNDALDRTRDLLNQQTDALERSIEYTLRASDIRLQAEIDLKQTLGRSLSLQEQNVPFEANIRGLTAGVVRGGTTDPAAIGQGIDRLIQENQRVEARIAELQGSLGTPGGSGYQAGLNEIERLQQGIVKNNVAINNGTKALQSLADGAGRAQRALNKIQEQQQKAEAFGAGVEGFLTATPDQAFEMNKQLEALLTGQAFASQGRLGEMITNPAFAQDFFAGLNRFGDILGPEVARQLRTQAIAAGLEVARPGVTANPEVRDRLIRMSGDIPANDPALLEYQAAIDQMSTANEILAEQQIRASRTILKQTEDVFRALKIEFPKIVSDSFEKVRQDAAAIMAARAGGNVAAAPAAPRSKGGVIYASRGALIKDGFKPKGKDTVPAMTSNGSKYMLQPGEFVVNKKATDKNYNLLKAINNGDNVSNGYAYNGGTIAETRQQRREAYEQRKAEARARFQEQKPGLARVLEAREQRDSRYSKKRDESPELAKAKDEYYARGGKSKTKRQYDSDRGQKLFGGFLASTGNYNDYYSALSPEGIFADLRATSERPLGFADLSLEDQALANVAIDNFISNYESGRTQAIDAEKKKIQEDRAKDAPALAKARADEARQAYSAGIVSLEDLGVTKKPLELDGFKAMIPDYTTARELTTTERNKLRQAKLDKQFAEIDSAAAERNRETQSQLDSLREQKIQMNANRMADVRAQQEINPYTGKPYKNNIQKKLAQERAQAEGKTLDMIKEERAAGIARTTQMANQVKNERLAREQYAQEQADYEERMKVASAKAREERRYNEIRFQAAENKKGYLGYLAGGISDTYGGAASAVVESTPVQAAGQFGYGLGEIGYGLGVGTLGALSSAVVGLGTLGYRAAQYQGDLLGDKPFGPRSKLEDDVLAQAGIEATIDLAKSSVAAYGTIGTGFDRLGRALSFDKETMAKTGESASAKRQREISESLPRNSSYIPLPGGNTFRIPSMGESYDVANIVAEEAAMAAIPMPALKIPGLRLSKSVGTAANLADNVAVSQIDEAAIGAMRTNVPKAPKPPSFGQRMMASMRGADQAISAENAARIADIRTGSIRARNPLTGRVERIPEAFSDNPEAFFQLQPAASQRVLGRNFERNIYPTNPLGAKIGRSQDQQALRMLEDIVLPEEAGFVDGLSPMQQSIIGNNATVAPVVSRPSPIPQSLSPMEQAIMDAMALSDEQLGITDISRRQTLNNPKPVLENMATRDVLEKEATRRRMSRVGYYYGGIVRGQSGRDAIDAQVTAGEFIVNNKDTSKNIEALRYINNGGVIKPQRMYDGGQVGAQTSTSSTSSSSASSFGGSYTISLEDRSRTFMETFTTQLNTFGTNFDSYITKLAQIKIPDKIEMSGRHTVEVNVTGAAAFEAMEEGVRSLINTEIGKKMNMLWNQSGGQLGEAIPTGDVGARRGSPGQV